MRRHQFALGPDASQNYAIAEVYRSKVSDGAPAGTNSYSQPRIQQGTGPVIVLMTIAEQLAAVVDAAACGPEGMNPGRGWFRSRHGNEEIPP